MIENQEPIIDNFGQPEVTRRRKLLPWWIKMFCWIFMVFGAIVPVGLVFGILGFNFQTSLYGLETTEPLSYIGLLLIVLFLLKGAAAFGLWTEKDWAIQVGKADAIIGIIVCLYSTFGQPFLHGNAYWSFHFQFEIILLLPYYYKLEKIKEGWMHSTANH